MPPDRPVFHSGYYLCLFWARERKPCECVQNKKHSITGPAPTAPIPEAVCPSVTLLETPMCEGGLHVFSFSLHVSPLSMRLPHAVFFVLFSNSAHAVFHSTNKSPLWFSSRPPACQFKPRHPSTDKITALYMSKPSQSSLSGFGH